MNKNTILVLAPHTDDGELACGGSIARFCEEGRSVYYVAFSTCSKSLASHLPSDALVHEVKAATTKLGVMPSNLILFDYDVRSFKQYRQEILEDLVKLNQQLKPDLILTPSPTDIHQDHQVISEEAIRAFKKISILGYEMPWNNLSFNTRCFITLEEKHIERKMESLTEYKTQADRPYFQNDFVKAQATMRGIQISTRYAEAFEVIRWTL